MQFNLNEDDVNTIINKLCNDEVFIIHKNCVCIIENIRYKTIREWMKKDWKWIYKYLISWQNEYG